MTASTSTLAEPAQTIAAPVQTKPWFVAVVLTNLERVVKMRIDELGQPIETFLPLVETQAFVPARPATRHRPERPAIPQICAPMFKGYLFVSVDPDDARIDWEAVRQIRGFLRVLTNAYSRPIRVRGIDRFLAEANGDGLISPEAVERLMGLEPSPRINGRRRFQEGDAVRVRTGHLAGYLGIFESDRGELVNIAVAGKRTALLWDQIEAMA